MKKTQETEGKKGSALIMVVFTVFLVMLVTSSIFVLSRRNFMSVNRDEHTDKAEYAAKAGLEHAIAMLADDQSIGSFATFGITGQQFNDITMEGNPEISYDLVLINNDLPPDANGVPQLVAAPDGLQVPPGVVWVKSTGKMRDLADSSSSSLIKLVGYQRPILKQALFGINYLRVSNNSLVDAYDSTAHYPGGTPFAPLGRRGDIGVNAVQYNNSTPLGIDLDSSSTLHGQARVGVGSPSIPAVAKINGTHTNLENPANPSVISEEATQVPRFVLGLDPLIAGYGFPHHLVVQDLSQLPTPPSPAPLVYKGIPAASPSPPGVANINDTALCDPVVGTPTPDAGLTGYGNLRILNPGFYDMTADGGSVRIEDTVFRDGKRYHFLGDVTFAGQINIGFHDAATSAPYAAPEDGPLAVTIYVDGNVTFEAGCQFNMDLADEDGDGDAAEPLAPRRVQIYTSNDRGEQFQIDTHTVTVGQAGAARTSVSAILCGANMEAIVENSDFYGGIQALGASVRDDSNVYLDTNIWGVPLEGRGQIAVLLNTVQVYAPIVAPAPAPPPATGPAPAPTYFTTGPGYCSPIIPLPLTGCY